MHDSSRRTSFPEGRADPQLPQDCLAGLLTVRAVMAIMQRSSYLRERRPCHGRALPLLHALWLGCLQSPGQALRLLLLLLRPCRSLHIRKHPSQQDESLSCQSCMSQGDSSRKGRPVCAGLPRSYVCSTAKATVGALAVIAQ